MIQEQELNTTGEPGETLWAGINHGLGHYLKHLRKLDIYEADDERKVYEGAASDMLIQLDNKVFIVLPDEDEQDFYDRFLFRPSETPLVDISYSEANKQTVFVFRTQGKDGPVYPEVPISFISELSALRVSDEKWSSEAPDPYREQAEITKRVLKTERDISKALSWLTRVDSETLDNQPLPELIDNMKRLLKDSLTKCPEVEWRVRISEDLDTEDELRQARLTAPPYELITSDGSQKEFGLTAVQEENSSVEECTLVAKNIVENTTVMNIAPNLIPKSFIIYPVDVEIK